MSLQDQIDEAWKSYCGDAELNPNIHPEKQEGFEDGYRAMAKRLYREIEPKEMKLNITYMIQIDGRWHERNIVTIEYRDTLAELASKVYEVNLPHPSDIFGEEGA